MSSWLQAIDFIQLFVYPLLKPTPESVPWTIHWKAGRMIATTRCSEYFALRFLAKISCRSVLPTHGKPVYRMTLVFDPRHPKSPGQQHVQLEADLR